MRVGERVAGRGSGSEGLGGLRTECRHGWRGRRAQGRGRSVWRGGKGSGPLDKSATADELKRGTIQGEAAIADVKHTF